MNFFERQHAARRATSRLIGLFVLAVLAIVIAVDLVVLAVVGSRTADPQALSVALAVATVLTFGLIGLGSLYRIAMLSGGGGDSIALQLGGVPVPERSEDLQYKRLRNVVEEMAIASGVPMPRLFVLEHEAGINAFAAGWSPSDAAIGVTRGALERLNRDELQAVVAHEFSHILNGDMRLNLRLIGVLFGILMLALVGQKILEHGRYTDRDKGAAAVLVLALAAMLIGYIGLFFGRMIKAGVSRSREFLADASAVQFTRQNAGLAGALKKIGGLSAGAKLNHAGDAEEISHMLFGDGVGFDGMKFGDWFATHPPLVERIRALDPAFRAEQLPRLRERWAVQPPVGIEEDVRLGLAPVDALPSPSAELRVTPAKVAAQVAKPAADDYRRADAIVAGLPDSVRALAASRDDAIPLILGLLLDTHPRVQTRQHEEIVARLGRPTAELARLMQQQHLHALHPMLRLPLASLTFPVLRQRPRPELGALLDTVHAVAHTDDKISAFEYCLACLLETQLRESLAPGRHAQFGRRKLSDTRHEAALLLALVAQAGHDDEAGARRAYNAGLQRILPHGHIDFAPPAEGMPALDAVWPLLDALDPLAKGQLVEAVAAAIGHDGEMRVVEAELLRTVCGVLHCPLPPMLERG